MKQNRILASLAAVALSSATLLGVASPAFADDEVTTEVAAPAVVEEVAAPAEPVAEPPAEEPPVAEPVVEEPVVEPPAEEAPAAEPVVEEPVAEAPPADEVVVEETSAEEVADAPAVSSFSIAIDVAAAPENDKKVYVCKIVASDNAPGGFRLQTGQNPIYVSINAIGNDVNNTGTFNDQQPSFIVPGNDVSLCAHTDVIVEEEVICPSDQLPAGVVNITTTTKYYLGSTLVHTDVEYSTRALTEAEMDSCDSEDPLVASASVSLTDPTCYAGQQVVLGTAINATWGEITDPAGDDDYSVTATANEGAIFDVGGLEQTFAGELLPPLDPEDPLCDLPTKAEVLASASATNATCSASGTLNVVLAEHVLYWVGADQLTTASTAKAPGNYTVTATTDDPENYTIIGTTEWPLTIAAATGCVTTAGLASTGATKGTAGLWAGLGLVFLGSAAFYLRRRFGAAAK